MKEKAEQDMLFKYKWNPQKMKNILMDSRHFKTVIADIFMGNIYL